MRWAGPLGLKHAKAAHDRDAPFRRSLREDDAAVARRLLASAGLPADRERRIDRTATRLIEAIRGERGGFGGVEDMLREYSLSTKEGLALMVLAEALLRVPDGATADRLIEDKLGQGDFAAHESKSDALLVSASAWALGLTARVIQPGETPEGIVGQLAQAASACPPCARRRARHAGDGEPFRARPDHRGCPAPRRLRPGPPLPLFLRHAGRGRPHRGGRAALFASYAAAIEAIGRSAGNEPLPNRPASR
jgi:RHH-type proline utilization regulon transcriptional repressor/proline dehydrogenase/delta 1-pyrroline-5-carboxylate dehydrogenase